MSHNENSQSLVWEMYKNLVAQCEHFNGIESTYRALASTWLLAAFAAMGFVLKDLHGNSALLIAGISAAAAVGIYLLWLLDLVVYHRLLAAAFIEQLALEDRHPGLPQSAHRMMAVQGGVGVVPKIVWFYIGIYALLIGIAAIALVAGVGSDWSMGMKVVVASDCLAMAGLLVAVHMYRTATAREGARESGAHGLAARLDHIVLTVRDIEVTTKFYERALGFEREFFRGPEGQARFALRFGLQKINLQDQNTSTPTKARTPTVGSGDFCLIAAMPLENVIERLRAENVAIEAGPVARRGALGPIRSVYFRDPDGNLVEVAEYVSSAG